MMENKYDDGNNDDNNNSNNNNKQSISIPPQYNTFPKN